MIPKNKVSPERKKELLFYRDNLGRISVELEPWEVYWCVNSDHALVFLPSSETADMELSRKKLFEMGRY